MIFDLHNDFVTAARREEREKALRIYANANVRGIVFAVYTTEIKPTDKDFVKYSPPEAPFMSLSAIEDLGSVRTDDYESFLRKTSPCYVSLTWNGANSLAGGVGAETPLTDSGKKVLKMLERLDIPLDLSHLSDKSFSDALKHFRGRVLVSHTASRKLCNHARCITDEMAKLVARRGGIIGTAAIPDFLGGSADRTAYLAHVAHLTEVIGADSMAIGTDFYGGTQYPKGLSEYADFAFLRQDMIKIGFTEEEIEKIFYKNAYRFLNLRR